MNIPEGKVLLIVEDQLLLAMTVRDALEDHGYRVLDLAIRHQEALDTVALTRPDLALVNIDLAGDESRPGPRGLQVFSSPLAAA